VEAIKEGKSVAKYFESLEDGTGTKQTIKPKIDEEMKAAKEAGLNFNVLCYIWLFDVGVTQQSASAGKHRTPMGVPKFLNRCLGMNLPRQKLMTEYFLRHLEKEVSLAKTAGEYDQGIKTCSGHSVVIDKPRSFCFRGLEAKNEHVFLYKVKADRGMDSEAALQLYKEAKELEEGNGDDLATTSTGGWFGGGQRQEISTGFFIDRRRNFFKEAPRMFLIISQGRASEKCIVVRPNEGKKIYAKKWINHVLIHGAAQLSLCTDIPQAVEKWNREFVLADRPSSERYQHYCYGRHEERFLFGGSIIPILNKILVSANSSGLCTPAEKNMTMPSIVRVEPSGMSEPSQVGTGTEDSSEEGEYISTWTKFRASTMPTVMCNQSDSAETPAVGQKVARKMLGTCIFRGVITEYKDCNADAVNQSGTYIAEFTDGSNIEMNAAEVVQAKQLFEAEVDKLVVEAKVPKADASSIDLISAIDSSAQSATRRPVLTEGEDDVTEEYERVFEEEYDGDVPSILVGLEFPNRTLDWYSEGARKYIQIPFWEFVLRKLAEKLLEEGAKSSRELLNLEKAEQH